MQDVNWQLIVQFPQPQTSNWEVFLTRLIPEGLVRIWHPTKRIAWYRLTLEERSLQRVIGVLQKLQEIEDIQVFINQKKVDTETLWALTCYANPKEIYRLCEMQKSPEKVIGCPQGFLSLEAHHASAWYLKLRPIEGLGLDTWALPEASWKEYLNGRLGHFVHCPEFMTRGHLSYLDRLPTSLILQGKWAGIFTPIKQSSRWVLRVQNRDLYEQWLLRDFFND